MVEVILERNQANKIQCYFKLKGLASRRSGLRHPFEAKLFLPVSDIKSIHAFGLHFRFAVVSLDNRPGQG